MDAQELEATALIALKGVREDDREAAVKKLTGRILELEALASRAYVALGDIILIANDSANEYGDQRKALDNIADMAARAVCAEGRSAVHGED